MTLQPLPALYLAVLTVSHGGAAQALDTQTTAPDFWWDLTLNHSAPISTVLGEHAEGEGREVPEKELPFAWDLGWAEGNTSTWSAGGSARWTAWAWKSNCDSNITGGGFLFNKTGEETALGGVSWLRENQSSTITWNCFAEGNLTGPLPWSNWELKFADDVLIGFMTERTRWGFYVGSDLVLSKHCANGMPVVGKLYKFRHGKEIEKSVKDDPFKTVTYSRRKRSPDFFDRVGQKVKELFEKAKRLLGIGQQQDGQGAQDDQEGRDGGQKCNSFLDLVMRIINLIFRRRSTPAGPPGSPPGGNLPPPGDADGGSAEDDLGGDPPGGANVPPPDAEEIDTSQNDAIRDWE
ncbi:hypothetical protein B7P43_G09962 [Cryptotermes secundus]|uniref:B30.2/SPRY domain-containing protein n=1 Tax=Cryptotermes secundus TaxID=105785 RepID=A0A2J7PUF9_9NEOP|nr:uncharacterized protein LOC111871739 isoform X1 [Cryptotermes secundus]PNF19970.1 hypothetical protein B7P43_G09962 [Cryptotermes secundus]